MDGKLVTCCIDCQGENGAYDTAIETQKETRWVYKSTRIVSAFKFGCFARGVFRRASERVELVLTVIANRFGVYTILATMLPGSPLTIVAMMVLMGYLSRVYSKRKVDFQIYRALC